MEDDYWKKHYTERKRICSNLVTDVENIIQVCPRFNIYVFPLMIFSDSNVLRFKFDVELQIQEAEFDTCHSIGENHPVNTDRTEDPQRELTRVYFTEFRSLYSYGRRYIDILSRFSRKQIRQIFSFMSLWKHDRYPYEGRVSTRRL